MELTNNDYCQAILISQNMGLNSVEKFFLIRIICSFGLSKDIVSTVKELVKVLALSEAVLSRTRDELIKKGYVDELSGPLKSGGRPRRCFKISPRLLKLLKANELDGELSNSPCIEELLFTSALQDIYVTSREGSIKKIKPPMRILICIFLAHSSDVGLVSDLGSSDLIKLTGGSIHCLKPQLGLLRSVGFIMTSRSGFTNKQTKARIKSQYILNLAWKGLPSSAMPEQVILNIAKERKFTEKYRTEGECVNRWFDELVCWLEEEADISKLESHIAFTKYDVNMKRYIFWVILECASHLTENWPKSKDVPKDIAKNLNLLFEEKIIAKVWPSLVQDNQKARDKPVFKLVYYHAFELAKKVIKAIELAGNENRHNHRYLLLPSDDSPVSSGFCLFIYSDNKNISTPKVTSIFECGMHSEKMKLGVYQLCMEKINPKLKRKYNLDL